jgi:8-oxo-dGTP diphosphatase
MKDAPTSILQVAAKAAIVNHAGEVLIVREAKTGENNTQVGRWGLVGGRLDPGEPFFDGLAREVAEETGLKVEAGKPLYLGEWQPVIKGVPHQIVAIFMLCKAKTTDVRLSDEHDEYAWINPAKRHEYNMMEPDCFAVDTVVTA